MSDGQTTESPSPNAQQTSADGSERDAVDGVNIRRLTEKNFNDEDIDGELTTQDKVLLGDLEIKKIFSTKASNLFVQINKITVSLIAALAAVDVFFIYKGTPGYQRLITVDLLTALIAAVTVQLGAVMLILAKSLFPAESDAR